MVCFNPFVGSSFQVLKIDGNDNKKLNKSPNEKILFLRGIGKWSHNIVFTCSLSVLDPAQAERLKSLRFIWLS